MVRPILQLYWRVELCGAVDAIPGSGPLILAANHTSHLDPWFLGLAFPRPVRYLVTKAWYYRSRAWTAFFRAYGTEPVRQGDPRATFDAVCELLDRGEVVGIFPEGRISPTGRIQKFRPGLSRIAARSGSPVVPAGIRGAFASLPKHRRFPRPVKVVVHLGPPLFFPRAPHAELPSHRELQGFLERVFNDVRRLSGQEVETPRAEAVRRGRGAPAGSP